MRDVNAVTYRLTRMSIPTGQKQGELRTRFEEAVPPLPRHEK